MKSTAIVYNKIHEFRRSHGRWPKTLRFTPGAVTKLLNEIWENAGPHWQTEIIERYRDKFVWIMAVIEGKGQMKLYGIDVKVKLG